MSENTFSWAQSQNANVLEPIRELAEQGWQHRDIPKASNMNWIFKQISDDLGAFRKELTTLKEDLLRELTEQETQLHAKTKELYDRTTRHSKRHLMDSQFNRDVSRQMCDLLREMEKLIQHYHKDFPTLPWPLKAEDPPVIANEELLD